MAEKRNLEEEYRNIINEIKCELSKPNPKISWVDADEILSVRASYYINFLVPVKKINNLETKLIENIFCCKNCSKIFAAETSKCKHLLFFNHYFIHWFDFF